MTLNRIPHVHQQFIRDRKMKTACPHKSTYHVYLYDTRYTFVQRCTYIGGIRNFITHLQAYERERERTRFHSSIYNVQREIYIQPRQIADKRAIERALRTHENTRM